VVLLAASIEGKGMHRFVAIAICLALPACQKTNPEDKRLYQMASELGRSEQAVSARTAWIQWEGNPPGTTQRMRSASQEVAVMDHGVAAYRKHPAGIDIGPAAVGSTLSALAKGNPVALRGDGTNRRGAFAFQVTTGKKLCFVAAQYWQSASGTGELRLTHCSPEAASPAAARDVGLDLMDRIRLESD
jgi:hypothetical protein